MWSIVKATGRPLHPELIEIWDWPNTITFLISLRQRYDSYMELPEVPPEEYWDFPHLIRRHIEELFPSANKTGAEVPLSDIED